MKKLEFVVLLYLCSLILPAFVQNESIVYLCIAVSILSSIYLVVYLSLSIFKLIKESK